MTVNNEPNQKPREPLRTRRLANNLIQRAIHAIEHDEIMRETIALDGTAVPLYRVLEQLANTIWLPHAGKATPEETARYATIMAALDAAPEKLRFTVIDFIAHAGQLHQMAGQLARESLIENSSKSEEFNPVHQMLYNTKDKRLKFPTAEEALKAIARPRFEVTLTGHPTNTNSLESMHRQRELAKAVFAFANSDEGERTANYRKAREALAEFARAPLLPMKDGQPTPLTVTEETKTMLYFLNNLYEDLPQTYHVFDQQLAKSYGANYDPRQLDLKFNFHSWGSSGDKDGNDNVNAQTTLGALMLHKAAILGRYAEDMKALGLPSAERLAAQGQALAELHTMFEAMRQPRPITDDEFNAFSARLGEIAAQVDLSAAMKEVEGACSAGGGKGQPALDLLRRMKLFGTNFGQIEYRETAEEYTRVIEKLVPHYAEMDEAERCANLTTLLGQPHKLQAMTKALQETLSGEAHQRYHKDDAGPIAYQTLKRMELARDFPDAIQRNVLAECKNVSNVLEALVLQHAVAKDDKRPMMGIVPLFEEHETLAAAPSIVRDILHNPAYQKHLADIAAMRGTPEAQQIQLAHSDNFKRGGIASRALLARAHEELRETVREFSAERGRPLEIQFYEGGSQSDPLRGGARATSAMVNAYSIHDFFKATFQGGDLLNFFNLAASSCRLFTNNLANAVTGAARETRRRPDQQEKKIIAAFDEAKDGYIEGLFKNEQFIDLLNRIDYAATTDSGNYSSRIAARSGAKTIQKINDVRAIGYSETMQHAGLVATWVGVQDIEKFIEKAFGKPYGKSPVAKAEFYKKLYEEVPVYRDIIDKMSYGLMRSDLKWLSQASAYADGTEHPLMPQFRQQYAKAFELCMCSYTGAHAISFLAREGLDRASLGMTITTGDRPVTTHPSDPEVLKATIESGALRGILKKEIFPHVADMLGDQERLLALAHHFEGWSPKPMTKDSKPVLISPEQRTANGLIHNIKDSVHHGVIPEIIDTKYAKLYCDHYGIKRPWVLENETASGKALRA